MIYLLHIDTSADTGVVAVGADGKLAATVSNNEARNHASAINLMIEEVLDKAGITMQQLNGVVVCAGPGSYTGLRIGMATAKGICYALNISLLLDNKLTLIANQLCQANKDKYEIYIPSIAARENEYFIASYDKNMKEVMAPRHIDKFALGEYIGNDLNKLIISSALQADDISNLSGLFSIETEPVIDMEVWTSYAFEQYKCNNIVNLSTAEPFYLKQVYTHK